MELLSTSLERVLRENTGTAGSGMQFISKKMELASEETAGTNLDAKTLEFSLGEV